MGALSFFTAKKSGASTTAALAAGALGGLGTYYVATETDWGKSVISDLDKNFINLSDNVGDPVLNGDGSVVSAPEGSDIEYNPDGTIKRDTAGNVIVKVAESAGDVLESWGGAGTAAVIGATAVAANPGLLDKLLPYALILGGAILIS